MNRSRNIALLLSFTEIDTNALQFVISCAMVSTLIVELMFCIRTSSAALLGRTGITCLGGFGPSIQEPAEIRLDHN